MIFFTFVYIAHSGHGAKTTSDRTKYERYPSTGDLTKLKNFSVELSQLTGASGLCRSYPDLN
jgi:hypothetical protein